MNGSFDVSLCEKHRKKTSDYNEPHPKKCNMLTIIRISFNVSQNNRSQPIKSLWPKIWLFIRSL